jgi:hypothetical protein
MLNMSEKTCATCAFEGAPPESYRCAQCRVSAAFTNWVSADEGDSRIDVIGSNGNEGEHYDLIETVAEMRAIAAASDDYDKIVDDIRAETAPGLLKKAAAIMEERAAQYDSPEGERSMGRAVAAFNAITGRDLKESEGWLLLQVLKDVRQWQRTVYHADSAEDCIAYAALKAEALAANR